MRVGDVAALVPVKSFIDAKERLSPVLGEAARQELAKTLAEGVLKAVAGLHTAVVCDDDDVATWAHNLGAEVVWAPGRGLNRAVAAGVAHLESRGFGRITVVHADLPFPAHLATLPDTEGIVLVPDRHGDGTNVISIPAGCGFEFAYGTASFPRHLATARRLGLDVTVLDDTELGIDVDLPDDLELIETFTR